MANGKWCVLFHKNDYSMRMQTMETYTQPDNGKTDLSAMNNKKIDRFYVNEYMCSLQGCCLRLFCCCSCIAQFICMSKQSGNDEMVSSQLIQLRGHSNLHIWFICTIFLCAHISQHLFYLRCRHSAAFLPISISILIHCIQLLGV